VIFSFLADRFFAASSSCSRCLPFIQRQALLRGCFLPQEPPPYNDALRWHGLLFPSRRRRPRSSEILSAPKPTWPAPYRQEQLVLIRAMLHRKLAEETRT
jgi:hypothetical protein